MADRTPGSLLVVAAHPDDETLGCGGLMARTVRNGGRVAILILTEGSTTQYPDRPEIIEKKEVETRGAASELGVQRVDFARLPDMALSTLAPAEVNAPVERLVAELRPEWVAVHHFGDVNRDHQVAHEAARVACRPGRDVERLISYETPSSTEWGIGPFVPDLYVALEAADLEAKQKAFSRYETEMRVFPHPRSIEAIAHRAVTRGSEAGFPAAEAFSTVWQRI